MAEFALGLTKTAVEGTLIRVKSAIEEEAKLKVRVQNDLLFISGEFQMMQSFLKLANKERAKNEVVLTWVRQIRDLAFDVEDCVEFVVHLDKPSRWDWVRRLASSFLVCMSPLLLDMAVAEIKQLRTRVEDISQRNTRYNLITNVEDDPKPAAAAAAVIYVSSPPVPELMLPATAGNTSSTTFRVLSKVWEAMGKKRHIMGGLKRLINNEGSHLEVISLWGSTSAAHLWVTHAFREAYNDPEICRQFSCRAWIKLVHPFNPDDFLRSLLTQLYATSSHHQADLEPFFRTTEEYHLIKAELMQQVRNQRYLIILEDLFSVVEWDVIRMYLPDSKNGSRIVVATRQLALALSCTGEPYQVSDLRQFSDGQSLCAFFSRMELLMERYFRKECHLHIWVHRVTRFFSGRQLEAFEWREKYGLVGHQSEWSGLCYQLEGDPGVISVWGVAGVGKTTLVKHIYYTNIIGLSQYNLRTGVTKYSWVDVTYPFNLTDLSRSLLLDFHSDNLEAKETAAIGMMEGQDPAQECRNFMCRVKCFVVICGLRSIQDWDLIKEAFLSEPIEGCILVITNEASVARHCADDGDRVINVKGLEADAAFALFTKNLTSRKIKILSPREEELSKMILTKCGGHLKVIATIREYCQKERETEMALKSINDNFMGMLEKDPRFHNLKGLLCWMQNYFDACPDSLKPCIFYLSIFPSDHGFRQRRLLRRWIAEGYSRDKSSGSTAEEDGEMLYSKLVDLSIIQKKSPISSSSSSKKVEMYQVNGFFREYIVSRPMEDNLVFALEGNCRPNSEHTGKHLTIGRTWDRDEIVFKSLDLSRLRSLTVFGNWEPFLISDKMRLLRVLDLENTLGVTDNDLKQIGKVVPRLKFLSLRGCEKISHLPDSLGDMKQLQTLDVRGTQIIKLPYVVIKIENLQYVRAGMLLGDDVASSSVVAEGITREPVTAREEEDQTSVQPPEASETAIDEVVSGGCTSTCLQTSRVRWSSSKSSTDDSLGSSSWLSKLMQSFGLHCGNNYGVEVVAGVGTLTALRTIGDVNVSAAGKNGKAILKDLKKLTQLRKLGVSGINRKNWQELCCAISGYPHLESLSMRLDCTTNNKKQKQDDLCSLDDISTPPKTLRSLKLYGGNLRVSPVWLKQLCNLRKAHVEDLELIMSEQEDIDSLIELPHPSAFRRLCVKPVRDCRLTYGWYSEYDLKDRPEGANELKAPVLKIDCSGYRIEIVFGRRIPEFVKVLVVHCSAAGSYLELSNLVYLERLEEVWLTGTHSDILLREHLQKIVAEHENKPALRMRDELTQPSPELSPSAC
uniref:Uncharacterized protein n=1 Tax=Avena sativa TaxID=4498 RepID=A0ACD5W1F1_AVESA